jgi:hypothetical protein
MRTNKALEDLAWKMIPLKGILIYNVTKQSEIYSLGATSMISPNFRLNEDNDFLQ